MHEHANLHELTCMSRPDHGHIAAMYVYVACQSMHTMCSPAYNATQLYAVVRVTHIRRRVPPQHPNDLIFSA